VARQAGRRKLPAGETRSSLHFVYLLWYIWVVGEACRKDAPDRLAVGQELPSNRIARVLLCIDEGVLVALHAFVKKSQKTPDDELALVRKRRKELKS